MADAATPRGPLPPPTPAAKKPPPPPTSVPMRLPHRVADYFLVVGGVRQTQAAEPEPSAASVTAAAAESAQHSRKASKLAWTARILDRYPRTDFRDAEFPRDLEMFVFPTGSYELSPLCQAPESHCFVLTEADGTRVYGCALRFWEPLDEARLAALEYGLEHGFADEEDQSSASRISVALGAGAAPAPRPTVVDKKGSAASDNSGQLVYAPKAFVLVSHWPFFSNFERFLSTLHKSLYIVSDSNLVPVERVICNFIHEIPLPPQGKFEVEARPFLNPGLPGLFVNTSPWSGGIAAGSGEKQVPFLWSRPPPNRPPLRDFPLSALFRWLSLDNIVVLFAAVLTERRILFVSDRIYKLTIAAEAITSLLLPFFWRHIYIPLLPARLTDFICAPMPFICGVARSYLPDELLLDGVLVADLDQNTLTATNAEPVAPLPVERQASIYRHLKKLVVDPTTPLKPSQTIADAEIESAFFKFHVRLFANYREYMEAPSEAVLEKFQKQRFCGEHAERGQFLTDFMETQMFASFTDDRYDQCSRAASLAGRGAAAANLEILYFDESIDQADGKPAPFLQDSSQNIQPQARVAALTPSTEGLPKGSIYKYTAMPIPMSGRLFGQPREVPDLAGDSAVGGGRSQDRRRGMDIEGVSMKFFQEKRLYSQHFHSLRLRSAKQDAVFKDVLAYFRGEQAAEEAAIHDLERMTAATVDKDTQHTGTTVDQAWLSLRHAVQEQLASAADAFRVVREEVALPLYSCCSEREHQLKILFAEAGILEAKAAKGKAVVERAKAASIAAFARYESLRETMRERILSASEVSRIVAAQNDSEDSRLDLDESETSFHTIVSEYESRMPQLIHSIRQLNKERIVQLREGLTRWVSNRRANLLAQLAQLDLVSKGVETIDVEKDLSSFSEGTTDFWAAATRGTVDAQSPRSKPAASSPSNKAIESTPASQSALSEQAMSISPPAASASPSTSPTPAAAAAATTVLPRLSVTSPSFLSKSGKSPLVDAGSGVSLSYPLNLWGIDGFEKAASQATLTRKVMKELILALTAWAELNDAKAKKLAAVVKAVPDLLTNPPLATGQRALWEAMKQRSLAASRGYADFQLVLLKLVSDLNLTKGELKMSITRFREHRVKLEREVAAANDVLLASMQKMEQTARALQLVQRQQQQTPVAGATSGGAMGSGAFPSASAARAGAAVASTDPLASQSQSLSGLMSQKQLETQGALLERAAREAKEAAHEHTLNERNSTAIVRKHDICVARLLRLFEKKERYCISELKKAFATLAEQYNLLLIQTFRKTDDALLSAVKRVDLQAELKEFVEAAGGKVGPPPPPPPPFTAAASSSSTSPAASLTVLVDFGRHLGPNGYTAVAGLLQTHISFVRAVHFLLEELSSTDDLELKSLKRSSFKVRSCRPATTLNAASLAFEQLLDRLTEITEDNVRVINDAAQPWSKLKTSLKALAKAHETRSQEIERAYRKSVEERNRAVAAEKALEELLRLAHLKTEQATRDEEAAAATGGKKGLFSSFMSTPLRDVQSKEAQAQKEYERAKQATSEKEAALVAAVGKKGSDTSLLLQEMQQTEQKRWNSVSELLSQLVAKVVMHVDKQQTLLSNYSLKVADVSADEDLADFIRANATTQNKPPDVVREDYLSYVDAFAAAAMKQQAAVAAAQAINSAAAAELPPGADVTTPAPIPPPLPMPTTHHSYSNSTSLVHLHTHLVSPVPASVPPPPPPPAAMLDLPITRSRGVSALSSPPPVVARVPPPPPPLPSRQQRADSTTASTLAPISVEESSLAPPQAASREVSQLSAASRSEVAAVPATAPSPSMDSVQPAESEDVAEYQDENGDWITRHQSSGEELAIAVSDQLEQSIAACSPSAASASASISGGGGHPASDAADGPPSTQVEISSSLGEPSVATTLDASSTSRPELPTEVGVAEDAPDIAHAQEGPPAQTIDIAARAAEDAEEEIVISPVSPLATPVVPINLTSPSAAPSEAPPASSVPPVAASAPAPLIPASTLSPRSAGATPPALPTSTPKMPPTLPTKRPTVPPKLRTSVGERENAAKVIQAATPSSALHEAPAADATALEPSSTSLPGVAESPLELALAAPPASVEAPPQPPSAQP